jgi:hypothetical protein
MALLSLSAFLAEGAWALSCSPPIAACEAGMDACASTPSADSPEPAPAAHHGSPSSEGTRQVPSDSPACPMMVAAGACGVAALPAAALTARPDVVQQNLVLPPFDRTPDRIAVAAHFRPPRA